MIAESIIDFENSLPPHIKLAYLPNYGMVKLRLTAQGENRVELEKELDNYFEQLKALVDDILVSDKDEPLEAVAERRRSITLQRAYNEAEQAVIDAHHLAQKASQRLQTYFPTWTIRAEACADSPA